MVRRDSRTFGDGVALWKRKRLIFFFFFSNLFVYGRGGAIAKLDLAWVTEGGHMSVPRGGPGGPRRVALPQGSFEGFPTRPVWGSVSVHGPARPTNSEGQIRFHSPSLFKLCADEGGPEPLGRIHVVVVGVC